ncbi:MAG TPA: HEPN domain-containing protein [Candidatus Wirthbacteria bacterium]|nr:HEPN domain-containing protein [Candidatus Wirthbacteria bacterium]
MTKASEKIIQEWLRLARENLLFAASGLKKDFSPYHTVCFLCHGSAEKYLKAYLISQGWNLHKTHDLVQLCSLAIGFDQDFVQLKPSAVILNDYIIIGRYPADISFEPLTKSEAIEALDAARNIADLVNTKLGIG